MKLARNLGIPFILTLTGETRRDDLEVVADWPDLVVPNLSHLFAQEAP